MATKILTGYEPKIAKLFFDGIRISRNFNKHNNMTGVQVHSDIAVQCISYYSMVWFYGISTIVGI